MGGVSIISTEFKLEFTEVQNNGKTTAIIVAAGLSKRMVGIDKQFIELCGKPVIARSISAFENCDKIDNIVVVARKDSILKIQKIVETEGFKKVSDIVEGGSIRAESVRKGVEVCLDSKVLLIHDGARPLVTDEIIKSVIDATEIYGACTSGVKVKNTIKIIDKSGMIISTPNRDTLLSIQTPQGFKTEVYKEAIKRVLGNSIKITDDCMLVELMGKDVFTVDGSYENIKITTNEDILLAESIIRDRESI